jgi:hypothetical protein
MSRSHEKPRKVPGLKGASLRPTCATSGGMKRMEVDDDPDLFNKLAIAARIPMTSVTPLGCIVCQQTKPKPRNPRVLSRPYSAHLVTIQ